MLRWPSSRRLHVLAFALVAACGSGPDTTSATTGSSSTATSTTTGSSTDESTAASTTTGSTTAAPTSTTGTATTGSGNPCGCADDEVCVQLFDGLCSNYATSCEPNPNGCVAGYPCAEACQPLCGGNTPDACNGGDCPDEVDGAVHCFGI
ncbi:hypothetical protein [Nannocystis punicea]|uniref:Uncharacterized protein n=1 Tax=Nannocystis punicea TaxID=2995304 RepID=A0ABY7HDE9_9BACT|nr:hypothetical protein [Nannocystis poenicansa]WAS97311.1 hypothetical protein O0S08_14280 [Nannocystis poenicansa]